VEIKKSGEQCVILTQGGLFGGYALMLQQGKPVFHYNFVNVAHYNLAAPNALPPDNHKVVLDFTYDGGGIAKGGTATINVDANKSPGPR